MDFDVARRKEGLAGKHQRMEKESTTKDERIAELEELVLQLTVTDGFEADDEKSVSANSVEESGFTDAMEESEEPKSESEDEDGNSHPKSTSTSGGESESETDREESEESCNPFAGLARNLESLNNKDIVGKIHETCLSTGAILFRSHENHS